MDGSSRWNPAWPAQAPARPAQQPLPPLPRVPVQQQPVPTQRTDSPARPLQPAPTDSPRQNRASVKLETKGHKPSTQKHFRAPSAPTWLPSSFGDLRVKSGDKTAWNDKTKAQLTSFLSLIEDKKADKTKIIPAAKALIRSTKKLLPGLLDRVDAQISTLSAKERSNICIRVTMLLGSELAKTASSDDRVLLDAVLKAASARDPVLEAQLTEEVNKLASPGEDLAAIFGTLIKLTDEWMARFATSHDTRFLEIFPTFLDARIRGALARKEPFELVQLFDNLVQVAKETTPTGRQIIAGILDNLGPMIAPQIADDFVDGVVSGGGLDRRFFLLKGHCDAARIDFAGFMNPAVDKALARRIGSVEQLQDMHKIAAARKDEWGNYLQQQIDGQRFRLRPQFGADAMWRFMLAVQGDDRDAKKNAFYGAQEVEGLHPLVKSNMVDKGGFQASVDKEELLGWIDRAVMDHPDADLMRIIRGLDEPFGAQGYIFDVVKPTLHDRLARHLLTERFVKSVLRLEAADVEGAITALSKADVSFEKGEFDPFLAVAIHRLDPKRLEELRALVTAAPEGLARQPALPALHRVLSSQPVVKS
jgi:hypothetical protein